jgi:glutamate formiminotransferase/formiminotetrahydrofolate cyclodeaminase
LRPPSRNEFIEYAIDDRVNRLSDLSVRRFTVETASESVAPGGGSVSANLGALGAALGTMVANLSAHKRGWDERWEQFSDWAEKGKACTDELVALIDRDTDAFNAIMAAFSLPKGSDAEATRRAAAIEGATRQAIEIPLRVMEVSLDSMDVIHAMAEEGNPASASDAGVGALCARSAVMGAYLNVRINAVSLSDSAAAAEYLREGLEIQDLAVKREEEILAIVDRHL